MSKFIKLKVVSIENGKKSIIREEIINTDKIERVFGSGDTVAIWFKQGVSYTKEKRDRLYAISFEEISKLLEAKND